MVRAIAEGRRSLRTACVAVFVGGVFVSGCGHRHKIASEDNREKADHHVAIYKVVADAYLFDAVLQTEGKTRSFRLEMFVTDSVAALSGRGYFGKGALRGLMRSDSLLVYFPTTNEYVADTYGTLLAGGECNVHVTNFNPVRWLCGLPDSVAPDSIIKIERTDKSDREVVYRLSSNCNWRLSIRYDRSSDTWRPVELRFADTNRTALTATRREVRPRTWVNGSYFSAPIPDGAIKLGR